MKVNREWLDQRTNFCLSVTRKMAETLGLEYPLRKGWVETVLSTEYELDTLKEVNRLARERKMKMVRKLVSGKTLFETSETRSFPPAHNLSFDDLPLVNYTL